MSADLNFDQELEDHRTACGVCGQEMIVRIPTNPAAKKLALGLLGTVAHDECGDQAKAEKKRRENLAAYSESWKLLCPPEFNKEISFSTCGLHLKPKYEQIIRWKYGPKGLIAFGGTGRCKTRFMFRLVRREHFAGRKVVYVRHPEFREKVSRLSFMSQMDLFRYMADFRAADIVFFDDLGKGRITDASEEALESMIDERTRNEKPIFFTSNEGQDSLAARLSQDRGMPMIRRILDFCEIVDFGY